MEFLIHLFHTVITYPALNLLVYCSQFTHNFGTGLLLLSVIAFMVIVVPWGLMDERMIRAELRASLYEPALVKLYPWRYRGMNLSRGVFWTFAFAIQTLSWLYIYITIGLFFALPVLAGSPLKEVNAVLYPFVPHLSALPTSHTVLFGQDVAVLQRGFSLGLLPLIFLSSIPSAVVKSWLTLFTSRAHLSWFRLTAIFLVQSFSINCVIALALSFVFASGAVLYLAVFTILYNLLIRSYTTFILYKYVSWRGKP